MVSAGPSESLELSKSCTPQNFLFHPLRHKFGGTEAPFFLPNVSFKPFSFLYRDLVLRSPSETPPRLDPHHQSDGPQNFKVIALSFLGLGLNQSTINFTAHTGEWSRLISRLYPKTLRLFSVWKTRPHILSPLTGVTHFSLSLCDYITSLLSSNDSPPKHLRTLDLFQGLAKLLPFSGPKPFISF